jgi:hypothetical protein
LRYRSNQSACWSPWGYFADCATYRSCEGYPCHEITYYKPAQRARVGFPQPNDDIDPQTGGFTRDGYDVQVRIEATGRFRLKRLLLASKVLQEDTFGDIANVQCAPTSGATCQVGCLALECPGVCSEPPDYDYQISTS